MKSWHVEHGPVTEERIGERGAGDAVMPSQRSQDTIPGHLEPDLVSEATDAGLDAVEGR